MKAVLILVVVEIGLGEGEQKPAWSEEDEVLILVVVEVGLGAIGTLNFDLIPTES